MPQRHEILIVEDDKVTRALLSGYFNNAGYRTHAAEDARSMQRVLNGGGIDLVLLDINLPGRDGLSITQNLRAESAELGIILVSSRSEEVDRIIGLELGADDYVVKPFNERELLARVKVLLRRIDLIKHYANSCRDLDELGSYRFDHWTLSHSARQVYHRDGRQVELTNGEFRLLLAFVNRAGRAQSRDQLLDAVSNREWSPNDRTIDVMVNRLRRKLEVDARDPKLLITIHGVGYQFTPEVVQLTSPLQE
ncbi:two component transcriptional regulator, winged helix family [Magnetococcus marinus MC-1]|uniref:Two component transcriptional regulator, winged helix family n=1 Tax=Magnetococcus marinus (strain ATCC BAA-1437 / JCM 17883 / MC-1) TaxID=156889 RepID=A0L527_MAGMM|nr:response regulator [Magnetococcus marinus]ABK43070.1 two component transcriptional regulator, winged helix family [Magnetococcus marinus MC-1]